jgi:drug/metabolite transporter (DMT)-like permease
MKREQHLLQKTHMVIGLALLCCFLWGSAFPSIKIGYQLFRIGTEDTSSQILFAGIRFTLAGILAVILSSFTSKKILIPKKNDIAPVFILSLFQTILQYFFFYIGLANTSGVKASVIIGANVFIAILILF